jgi:hypothetical protein
MLAEYLVTGQYWNRFNMFGVLIEFVGLRDTFTKSVLVYELYTMRRICTKAANFPPSGICRLLSEAIFATLTLCEQTDLCRQNPVLLRLLCQCLSSRISGNLLGFAVVYHKVTCSCLPLW